MFLKGDDADLFVTSFGRGPRTIVAHGGWVGSGELWLQPFERLSKSWRTVTYDHRGTGATVNRSEKITFGLLVDDLFRVLDWLQIGECVLAGESSGVLVVLEAALRQPTRFTGLVLVDGRAASSNTAGAARFIAGCKTNFEATMDAFVRACVTEKDAEAELRWAKQIVMRSGGPAAVELMESMFAATRAHPAQGAVRKGPNGWTYYVCFLSFRRWYTIPRHFRIHSPLQGDTSDHL